MSEPTDVERLAEIEKRLEEQSDGSIKVTLREAVATENGGERSRSGRTEMRMCFIHRRRPSIAEKPPDDTLHNRFRIDTPGSNCDVGYCNRTL